MTIQNANFPSQHPTLSLDFARTRQLDPRITFSRISSGTYFDQNGVLQTALAGVARFDHDPTTGESLGLLVEEARTNSVTYSDFQSGWSTTELTVVPNAAVAPDGTMTATKLIPTTATSWHFIDKASSLTSSQRCVSVFVKAAEISEVYVGIYAYTGQGGVFDLTTGTTSSTGATITPYPNGWYRVSYQVSYAGRYTLVIHPGTRTNTVAGNGVDGIYVWGAQYENGASFPTSYIPTPATFTSRASTATYYDANGVIQTAGIDVARSNAYFPDENGIFRPAGLLLEAAGTNYRPISTPAPSGIVSTSSRVSLSTTTQTTPANTQDALLHEALISVSSTQEYFQGYAFIPTTGKIVTSVFVKNISATKIRLSGDPSNQGYYSGINSTIDFTVSPPTITKGTGVGSGPLIEAGLVPLPNGWYRAYQVIDLDISSVTPPNGKTRASVPVFVNGVSGQQFLSWGYQIEAGNYPTSYIPTSGSTVTRAADVSSSSTVTRSADVAEITGNNFSSWYNQRAGTWLSGSTGDGFILTVSTNASNRYYLQSNSGNGYSMQTAGVVQFNKGVSGFTRASIAYSPESSNVATDGTVQAAVNSTLIPTANSLKIGMGVNNDFQGLKRISRLAYWPTRLPDATLQALTR